MLGSRLELQPRDTLVAKGRQRSTDKGYYGCHTFGAAGRPIGPDLRAAAARHVVAYLASLRGP